MNVAEKLFGNFDLDNWEQRGKILHWCTWSSTSYLIVIYSFQSRVLIYLGARSSRRRGDSACMQWAGIIAACLGTQHPKQIKPMGQDFFLATTHATGPQRRSRWQYTVYVADGGNAAFQLAECADAEDLQETCSQVLENLSAWAGGTHGPNQAATSGTDPTSTGSGERGRRLCTYLRGDPSRVLLQRQASVSPSAKGVDFSLGKSFEIWGWEKKKSLVATKSELHALLPVLAFPL